MFAMKEELRTRGFCEAFKSISHDAPEASDSKLQLTCVANCKIREEPSHELRVLGLNSSGAHTRLPSDFLTGLLFCVIVRIPTPTQVGRRIKGVIGAVCVGVGTIDDRDWLIWRNGSSWGGGRDHQINALDSSYWHRLLALCELP
jgi:hypothetical protein